MCGQECGRVCAWVCNESPWNINCILQAKAVLTGVFNRGPNLVWIFASGVCTFVCVCVLWKGGHLSLWMNLCMCTCVAVPMFVCEVVWLCVSNCVCVCVFASVWCLWRFSLAVLAHRVPYLDTFACSSRALQLILHLASNIKDTLQHQNTLFNSSFQLLLFMLILHPISHQEHSNNTWSELLTRGLSDNYNSTGEQSY